MNISIQRSKLRKIFSRIAKEYDAYAFLQKRIGQQLLSRICQEAVDPEFILDIGMGTGWLTKRLSLLYPQSHIFGIDFAEGMVCFAARDKARYFLSIADAESLPFKTGSFELAISNLAYQWVNRLTLAFAEVRRVLKKDGRFYLTCFGKKTLVELKNSLSEALNQKPLKRIFIPNNSLPSQELIYESLLELGFTNIKINSYIEKEFFDDIFALVEWLKKIGANQLAQPTFIGKNIWEQANRIYLSNYRENTKAFASFEVIWAEGLKE